MRAWELQAKGIIHAADEEAIRLEAELADKLRTVLSEPKFAAFFSVLGTPSYHGEVHQPTVEQPAPAPAQLQQQAAPTVEQPAPAVSLPAGLTGVHVDPAQVEKLIAGLPPETLAALAAMGQAVVQQGIVPVPTPPAQP